MLLPFLMALAAPLRSCAKRGLAYGPDPRQTIEVHSPSGADGEAPVVVVFEPCDRRTGQILAARGLVAVVAGLGADWGAPGAVEEAARACAWARAHAADYGGDPARLFVLGHAEGAWLAARLAMDPHWLASVGLEDSLRGAVGVLGLYELDGEPPVRSDGPPVMLVCGRADGGAPDGGAGRLAQRLRAAGAEVAEIGAPWLEPTPLHSLFRSLRLRLMTLDEIERFIRLRSLSAA